MRTLLVLCMIFSSGANFAMHEDQVATLQSKSSRDTEWHSAVKRIIENVSKHGVWREFFSCTECQTESGLVLECNEEDRPIGIHMQYGSWKFIYTSGPAILSKTVLLPDAQLEKYPGASNDALKDEMIKLNKLHLYSVLKVDGIVLPQPAFKEKKNFISIPEALDKWATLKRPSRSNK